QSMTITWTSANVSANDVVTLCLDTDATLLNGNEKWIEIDKAAASDGTYTFNPARFAPGTYYVGGYMYDEVTHVFTTSHLTGAITIPAPTFTLTAPTSGTYAPGQSMTITWTSANVSANDVVTLCLDTDTTLLNGNEKWIEIDKAAASDGTYTFNPARFAPGTYYVGGYMYDKVTHVFTTSHLAGAITIPAPTFTLTAPTSGTYGPGQPITVTWTATNVTANDVVTLCLDTDATLLNGNEKWIEIDKAAASDGTYTFDPAKFAPGTYYVGGYMYDKVTHVFTTSHLTGAITTASTASQSSSLLAAANTNSTGTDGASLVDNPNNLAITTKDLVFSSGALAASNSSQRIMDAAGADNQDEDDISAQTDAKEEVAAIDRVLQDQDIWLEQSSENWLT
ncbi:MAG: hypothetical protein ABSE63_01150, partial [Thermoguttaceae bacterium]